MTVHPAHLCARVPLRDAKTRILPHRNRVSSQRCRGSATSADHSQRVAACGPVGGFWRLGADIERSGDLDLIGPFEPGETSMVAANLSRAITDHARESGRGMPMPRSGLRAKSVYSNGSQITRWSHGRMEEKSRQLGLIASRRDE
jgi:hypothetical protein